jgi:hypothetical protein
MWVTSSLFRVKDEPAEADVEPSAKPRLDDQLHEKNMMKRLWKVIQDFGHPWLMTFLLDLP